MSHIDNTEQHEQWNGDSGRRWVGDADRRDEVLAPVGDALLAAARPRPGEKVLDIGCGCGATTLAAGSAVGPAGAVTGIDLSGPMLDLARQRRDTAQATNVDFVDGDAQAHALSPTHDLAISRFGTMFFADPTAAFANIATALSSGGRICLATWQPLVANDWLTIPGAALLQYGTMPASADDAGPGMFAQSEPDAVTAVLAEAGYLDIGLDPVTVDLHLGANPNEATEYLAESGVGRAVLETVADDDRPAALDAVRTVLADHTDQTGVHLGAAIWIITAARPLS
jgi:ubiquinone/menaquinone biosynthesis C-methylase UbiE